MSYVKKQFSPVVATDHWVAFLQDWRYYSEIPLKWQLFICPDTKYQLIQSIFKFYFTLLDEFCCYPICCRCSVIFKLLNSYFQFFKRGGGIYFLYYWPSYKLYIVTVCGGVFLVIGFIGEVIELFIPSCQHLILIANDSSIFCLTYLHPRFKFFLFSWYLRTLCLLDRASS